MMNAENTLMTEALDEKADGVVTVETTEEDAALDKRILRKIDGVVLTLVTIVATLEFLDKNVGPSYKTELMSRAWPMRPSLVCGKIPVS